jgi:hypothetical protein
MKFYIQYLYKTYSHNWYLNNSKTIVIVALSIAMAFGIMFAAVAPMQAFAVSSNVDDNNDDVKLLKCKGGSQGFKSSGHKCH